MLNKSKSDIIINRNNMKSKISGSNSFPKISPHGSFLLKEQRKKSKIASSKLWKSAIFCFIFMLIEFIGGRIANSLSLMTNAAHLFSDFMSFMFSLLAVWIGTMSANKNMSFG